MVEFLHIAPPSLQATACCFLETCGCPGCPRSTQLLLCGCHELGLHHLSGSGNVWCPRAMCSDARALATLHERLHSTDACRRTRRPATRQWHAWVPRELRLFQSAPGARAPLGPWPCPAVPMAPARTEMLLALRGPPPEQASLQPPAGEHWSTL